MSQLMEPAPVAIEPVVPKQTYGIIAEFSDPDKAVAATRSMYENGYRKLDLMSPFPLHGVDEAMGSPRSYLGYFVLCCGGLGLLFGFLLQWWTGGVDYPLVIDGKPFFALESSIPVMFECTILASAFASVFGMLWINGLPRYYHPFFKSRVAERVTDDRFLLAVEATGSSFDASECARLLESFGALSTELVED